MSQQPSVRTSPEAPQSSLPGPRSALYVVHPPELAGQVHELIPGSIIGREGSLAAGDANSAVPCAVLAHATVSRRHCLVRDAFGVPVLEDLGSSNGTRVDGQPLTSPRVLLPQSVVRIGSVLCIVDERPFPGAEWSAALPGIAPAVVRARDALRRAGTYVKFSCAELSRELAHSQLFGHERGAFTGAGAARHRREAARLQARRLAVISESSTAWVAPTTRPVAGKLAKIARRRQSLAPESRRPRSQEP